MSTKIYCAWRTRISRLNDFIDDVHEQVDKASKQWFMDWLSRFKTGHIYEVLDKPERPLTFDQDHDLAFHWVDALIKECERASNQSLKSMFDMDASMNIWLYKNHAYMIPFFNGSFLRPHQVKLPDYAHNFHYWDNVDRDETVSPKKWNHRGQLWEEVCLKTPDLWDKRRLVHTFIDMKDYTDRFYYRDYAMRHLRELYHSSRNKIEPEK